MTEDKGETTQIAGLDSLAAFSASKYNRIPIDGSRGLLRLICLEPDQSVPLHKHLNGDEYFYVVTGKATVAVGDRKQTAESGSIFRVPAGLQHRWKNGPQRLILLSVLVHPRSYEFAEEAARMEYV